jgi:septal ring factor EnvC (AmiA/AmiB activator)
LARQKDKSELEHLRGENRELTKTIRKLKRQVHQFEKSKHIYHEVISDYEEIIAEEQAQEVVVEKKSKMKSCEKCFSGVMEEFEIMDKVIGTCNSCGHRKRIK